MIPELTPEGGLPVGRYPASAEQVEQRFVTHADFTGSPTRTEVWEHWTRATTHLRTVVPVCAAWLAGSFLTSRADPDDLDVVYIIGAREALEARIQNPLAPDVLSAFATNKVRAKTGLRLDTFVIEWMRSLAPGMHPMLDASYFGHRGHWDDFWQRVRSGPKGSRFDDDVLPRRGYLEVILDGWSA